MAEQIAYVGADLRVHLTDAEGSETATIDAPGKTHAWPIWSPVGGRVAFSVFLSGSNGSGLLALYLHQLGRKRSRKLYTNEPGTDAIARGIPHYSLWSPDGARLALITRTKRPGLTLFAIDVSDPLKPFKVIDGMPIFASWSPDSRFLLVHSGREHYLVDFTGERGVSRLGGESGLYMAPSWSPVTNRWAVMREGGDSTHTLVIEDVEGGAAEAAAEVSGAAAFAWSADGDKLAIVRDPRQGARLYDGIWVVGSDGSGETRLTGDPVLSFFWSPTGSRIAYVTTSEDVQDSLRWVVVDAETGKIEPLADFTPTEQQLTAFMFFDQYAQSHSPWSQDSERIIFSGSSESGEQSVAFPHSPRSSVVVLDSSGGDATTVGEGFFGCWSRG